MGRRCKQETEERGEAEARGAVTSSESRSSSERHGGLHDVTYSREEQRRLALMGSSIAEGDGDDSQLCLATASKDRVGEGLYIRGRVFLNAPLEVLELTGKVSGEIAVNARIADERVDVLTNEMWRH
jgi:hypothetical protein